MYDIFSNNKIGYLKATASQAAGTALTNVVNFNEKNTGSPAITVDSDGALNYSVPPNNYERTSRALILIEVSNIGAAGTLTLTFQDMLYNPKSASNEWDTDFAVLSPIIADGLYAIDLKGFGEQLRISAIVGVNAVTWSAFAIGFEAERRPVVQSNVTVLTPTLATDRVQPMTYPAITDPSY